MARDDAKQIEVDRCGEKKSVKGKGGDDEATDFQDYDDMIEYIKSLGEKECRYIVFDCDFSNTKLNKEEANSNQSVDILSSAANLAGIDIDEPLESVIPKYVGRCEYPIPINFFIHPSGPFLSHCTSITPFIPTHGHQIVQPGSIKEDAHSPSSPLYISFIVVIVKSIFFKRLIFSRFRCPCQDSI
ncbi:hypothetical protein MAR_016973 [Mya arenaria]|uniref:Uncharacterized protein n=1 Tax=Mya arenaria TaxID=6604 RepID=A0ABY7EDA3_MYAAR|nr:hypothetical protein MAR_016973 [Mya arenaria]